MPFTKITGLSSDIGLGTDINWLTSDLFYNNIASNKTYTFSNAQNGATITVVVKNTSASDITLAFPVTLKDGLFSYVVPANQTNVYTFFCSNSLIYGASIIGMT